MRLKRNPFIPNNPVTDFDLFAGRSAQMTALVDSLYQVGHGSPRHTIVTGPRGIGKSSFINQINSLTENSTKILRELNIDEVEFDFNFIVSKHIARRDQSIEHIVAGLLDDLPFDHTQNDIRERVGKFVKRLRPTLSVGVISVDLSPEEVDTVLDASDIGTEFIRTVADVWSHFDNERAGIIFIVDEIDTVAENSHIASFLKVVSEQMNDSGLRKIAFFLVGITDAMDKLKEDHPSVARTFEAIEIMPMDSNESRDVILRTLTNSDEIEPLTFSDAAIETVISHSNGFPALIHQLCFHAFRLTEDDLIDDADLENALDHVVTNVRSQELGKALSDAGSGNYRKILEVMAYDDRIEVPLRYIAEQLGRKTSGVSSYITKLKRTGKVKKVRTAVYKIADPLLKLYIRKLNVSQPKLQL